VNIITNAITRGHDAIIAECIARQYLTSHSQELISGPKGLLAESIKRDRIHVVMALCALETLEVVRLTLSLCHLHEACY